MFRSKASKSRTKAGVVSSRRPPGFPISLALGPASRCETSSFIPSAYRKRRLGVGQGQFYGQGLYYCRRKRQDAIVRAVNPPGYRNWSQLVTDDRNTIAVAKDSGARILLPGTIYNYGLDAFPILKEDSPLRRQN
jgi:hypothetical protein